NNMLYHPPIPKQQPYLDYKGVRITDQQIKNWQNEVNIVLPITLLCFVLLIVITYKQVIY
ncbi:MAG: hypothetical protein Q4P13_13010, partial [Psychrobacter sp.]|nr:hypothetical protein [Psychrobacter sp.]